MLEYRLFHTYYIRCRLLTVLLILAVGLLFIRLGIWQLHRYHQKKQILQQHAYAAMLKPLSIKQVLARRQKNDWPLQVRGYYQPDQIIFFEQDVRFQARGYDILQVLRAIGHHRWLLVDRGWLPSSGQVLPQVNKVLGQVQLQGRTKVPSTSGLVIGPEVFNLGQWPLRVQRLRLSTIEKALHHPLYPFILRLNPEPDSIFKRQWLVVNVMPARHMSYALQWFAFAATLWIAYACFIVHQVSGVENEKK
jgi:surfeit locus 1 family protein